MRFAFLYFPFGLMVGVPSVALGYLVTRAGLPDSVAAAIVVPLALAIIFGYSYKKRFTWLSHMFLGLSLAIAPVGAWLAVSDLRDEDVSPPCCG